MRRLSGSTWPRVLLRSPATVSRAPSSSSRLLAFCRVQCLHYFIPFAGEAITYGLGMESKDPEGLQPVFEYICRYHFTPGNYFKDDESH